MARESGRKRSDKFQAKAESVLGADDGGQARRQRILEFDLKQVAWVEQDSSIERHAALAQLGTSALDDGCIEPFRGNDPNG